MKNIFLRNTPGLVLAICVLVASCGGPANEQQQEETSSQNTTERPASNASTAVDDETKVHVNQVLDEYYALNAALVDTDAEKAQSAGKKLAAVFKDFDISAVQSSLQSAYDGISAKIHQHAEQVAEAEDIEVQRENFVDITAGVYEMLKTFNANDDEVYYAYCPMAFDNTGGYWLSDKKEIRNPYFGSKMLKCGSVKETIAEN